MRSQAELERLFGGPEGVDRVKGHVRAVNDTMPELTLAQRDALTVLLARRIPPRPAPALPDRMPPRPLKRQPAAT
jgi:hypothetical protein